MKEIWKPVVLNGFDCSKNYEVSNFGNVRSLRYNKTRILSKYRTSNKEYYGVGIVIDGYQKSVLVSRLVYEAFEGQIKKGFVIDHKDSNPKNNNISNLQMITKRANCAKEKTLKSGLPAGVNIDKRWGVFIAKGWFNGKHINLGSYRCANLASIAYDIAVDAITRRSNLSKNELLKIVSHFRLSIGLKRIKTR